MRKIIGQVSVQYIFKHLFDMVKKFFYDIDHFWFTIANYNFRVQFANSDLLPWNLNKKIRKKSLDVNIHFLEKKFWKIIEEYKTKEISPWKNGKKVWVLRRQWIETAPDLIKICINSIKKHNCWYEIVLLDKDNYTNYVTLPEFIIDKVKRKYITITHLSDIIRMAILKTHWWIRCDATMYINSDIFYKFDNKVINSECSVKPSCWNNDKWCWFFMWWKPNKLFYFCYDFFIEYHKQYNQLINYFLIDYAIHIAYRNFEECKDYIDNMDIFNDKMFRLTQNFNNTYWSDYDNVIKNNFFKLTWKLKFHEKKDNKLTNYGKFIYDNPL